MRSLVVLRGGLFAFSTHLKRGQYDSWPKRPPPPARGNQSALHASAATVEPLVLQQLLQADQQEIDSREEE